MINKILLVIGTIFLLSGCSLDSLLKKSANNKLIDMKGFHGSKRRPLYNKKYIDRAKVNISQNDYEDEEDYEDEYADERMLPSTRNRYMYQDMIEDDMNSKRQKKSKKRSSYRSHMAVPDRYQDVAHAREIAQDNSIESDVELRKELSEIKSMLSSARKDLTKYRCPVEKAKEQTARKVTAPTKKLHEQVYSENDVAVKNATHKKAGPAHLDNSSSENITIATPSKPQSDIEVQKPQRVYADEPSDPSPQEVYVPAEQAPSSRQIAPAQPQDQSPNEPAIPALPKFPVKDNVASTQ